MKIERLRIDGFGHFNNCEVGPLGEGLTVLHGPNEAGKSTLLAFVRTMLFGFPKGGQAGFYPPLNGGRHGGRATLAADDGKAYVIERHAGAKGGTCAVTQSGQPVDGAQALGSLLGHASEAMYRSVFAFGIDELQTRKSLNEPDVGGRIYSAGMGASRLPEALGDIGKGMEAIFKPGGSAQEVAKRLSDLEEIQRKLDAAKGQAAEYGQLTARRDEIAVGIEAVRAKAGRLNSLKRCAGVLADALRALAEASARRDRLAAKVAEPVPDAEVLADGADIRRIQEGRKSFADSMRDLPERRAELRSLESRLAEMLRDLGEGWEEDRLQSFDTSLPVKNGVTQWRQRLEESDRDRRDAESAVEPARGGLRVAEEKAAVARREMEDLPAPRRRLPLAAALLAVAGVALGGGILMAGGGLLPALVGVVVPLVAAAYVFSQEQTRSALRERDSQAAGKRLEEAGREMERARRDLDAAEHRRDEAARAGDEARRGWHEWLAGRTLPGDLVPVTVLDLLSGVEAARAQQGRVTDMRGRVKAIGDDIREYRDLVVPLARRHGVGVREDSSQDVMLAADHLVERFEGARDAEGQRRLDEKALKEDQAAARQGESAVDAARTALRKVLDEWGKADADEARRCEVLLGVLEDATTESLGDVSLGLDPEIEECDSRKSELDEEKGRVLERIRQLAGDEETSALRQQRAVLVEELRAKAREWAVLAVAKALLEKTRAKFEKERQPDVIKHAQGFFETVTHGRYRRLTSPLGSQTVTVEQHDGTAKSPEQLSRGTQEQLYLALRFGLIREFGKTARLPVVVDEVLVNFDPERARRAAEAFVQLAETNQVLVFTCHPETVELFRRVDPAAGVIEIGPDTARSLLL